MHLVTSVGVPVYFWTMGELPPTERLLPQRLTFVYTVSFWPFWGLMHLWTRTWRG